MEKLFFDAQITSDKYWYRYFNGCLIYKKPLTAKYSCSIDIEMMIAEKIANRQTAYEFKIYNRALTKKEIKEIK